MLLAGIIRGRVFKNEIAKDLFYGDEMTHQEYDQEEFSSYKNELHEFS